MCILALLVFISFTITDNVRFIKHLLNILIGANFSKKLIFILFLFVHCLDIGAQLIFLLLFVFLILTLHSKTFLKLLFDSGNFLIDSLGVFK